MDGTLTPQDSQMLLHLTESLRIHLERLYWELSRRDALEGQHLKLSVGERCRVEFWCDGAGQTAHLQWVATKGTGD
jgi:hypothetical protein